MPENRVDNNQQDLIRLVFNLPPEEAIKFLENKAPQISYDWFDVYREEHVKAFTVAGLAKLDVLQDVQKALVEAQKKGQSLESFKQNFLTILRKKGWLGEQHVTRPDGSIKEVNLSAPWRVKTIYRTNMAASAMAGMYKELKAISKFMPYWRYVTVADGRVREEHARIHGKVLRHDDPFWEKYFPPNGYNCRCRVVALSEDKMAKKGLKVSNGKSMGYEVMPFVGTGWDYNPGMEDFKIAKEKYSKELAPIAEKIVSETQNLKAALKGDGEKQDIRQNVGNEFLNLNNFSKINNIEMFQKDKKDDFIFKELSSTAFNNLIVSARKKGAIIIRSTAEAEKHLAGLNASASTIGNILLFRKKVCISEVLEEIRHFEQNLLFMNDDKPEPLRTFLNEIEAKEYVLNNATKYRIPRNEIEFVNKQLIWYKEQLEEYKNGKE